MSYKIIETLIEDWQVKSFRFNGQVNDEIVNRSESNVEERLLIKEEQSYTLTIQGLTKEQKNEIYKKARTYAQTGQKATFYGIGTYKNDTIKMNYIGDTTTTFEYFVEYTSIGIALNGVLYDITFNILEER